MSGLIDRINGVIADTALKNPCVVVAIGPITLQGLQTVESILLQDGDRVLVSGQVDGIENGVYEARSGKWNRAPDMDGARDLVRGTLVRVLAPVSAWWELQTNNPIIGTTVLSFSEFFSSGGGTGSGTGTTRHYILALNGPAIIPSQTTLTLQGRRIDENGDVALTDGDVKLYANGQEVTEANGFGPGSNGYVGVFDADDITNSLIVQLRNDATNFLHDSKTLVDESPTPVVVISSSPGLTFYKAANGGAWANTQSVLTIEVYQNGLVIDTAVVTVTLDQVAGTLNAVETTSSGDIAISVQGQDEESLTVVARHLPSGRSEAEQLYAIQGGSAGQPGVSAYSAELTRPSVAVAAASDGTGYDLTNAGGSFLVRQGASLVTSGVAYSVLAPITLDGLTMAIDANGLFTLTGAWTSDQADFTLRAVVDGQTFDRPYTITKSRAGVDGGIGSQPVVVRKSYSNARHWSRALNAGAWTPLSPINDVLFEWTQAATVLASITVRFTLNTSTGNITAVQQGTATGGATIQSTEVDDSSSVTVSVLAQGVQGSAAVSSSQSGSDGLPGISGLVQGVGTGAVGNLTFAANTPSTGFIRISGDVVFLKNGTKYSFAGPIDLNPPNDSFDPLYIIVGSSGAGARFGAGFSSSNFFAATFDAATKQWTARGSGTEAVAFTPTALDTVVASTSNVGTTIGAIGNLVNPMNFDAATIGFFVQNGAITNALIDSLAANKISAGTIAANLVQTGLLEIDGAGRIVLDTGTSKLMLGAGFGSSNQFTFWWGPSVAEAAMTENNAVFYLKTDGSAYFGGSLTAGALYSSAQTTSIAANAEIEVGPLGSNGGIIEVVHSYQFQQQSRSSSFPGDPPPAPTAQIVLERSINGGAYSIVATRNITGTSSQASFDSGVSNKWIWNEQMSGSFTYTDSAQVAQNRQYRWRIVSRNVHPEAVPGSQNLTVASTED